MITNSIFPELRKTFHDLYIQLSGHRPSTNVGERYYCIIHLHESYINANDLICWFELRKPRLFN